MAGKNKRGRMAYRCIQQYSIVRSRSSMFEDGIVSAGRTEAAFSVHCNTDVMYDIWRIMSQSESKWKMLKCRNGSMEIGCGVCGCPGRKYHH